MKMLDLRASDYPTTVFEPVEPSFFTDYVKAVAKGEYDCLDAGVGTYHVVEPGYAQGLLVLRKRILAHLAVP